MTAPVLVAMECSGVIRRALRAIGIDAWSCDLKASADNSPFHIIGDVFDVIRSRPWRMVIAHPVCKFLTCSAEWAYKDADYARYPGVGYHQKPKPETKLGAERRAARLDAVAFVLKLEKTCDETGVEFWAFENPVGKLSEFWRPADMYNQPYEFGDDASKKTGWWVKPGKLPNLKPTTRCNGRWVEWPRGSGKMVERWSNQTDSGQNKVTPSDEREEERSNSFPGWADAIADQWGRVLFDLVTEPDDDQPDLFA